MRYRNKERRTNTNTLAREARISTYLIVSVCCRLQLCLFFFSHIVEALWLNELFFNEAALYPRRRCSSPVVLRENLANACLAHGTFSLLLATTPKRVLFTSRQARPSHPQHLSLPCLFLFLPALHLAAAQRETGRSVRDTVSLTLLSSPLLATTSLSLRCPGETVIDEALSLSLSCVAFSLFTLLSCSRPRFPLFPSRYGSPQTLD